MATQHATFLNILPLYLFGILLNTPISIGIILKYSNPWNYHTSLLNVDTTYHIKEESTYKLNFILQIQFKISSLRLEVSASITKIKTFVIDCKLFN